MARSSQVADPRPYHVQQAAHSGMSPDLFVPGTGMTWEGRARCAAARIHAGVTINEDDRQAVTRHPDAVTGLDPAELDKALGGILTHAERVRLARTIAVDAQATALANANAEWKAAARRAIRQTAERVLYFTTDDLWPLLDGQEETHERRALGGLLNAASRDGLIAATDRTQSSVRAVNHGRPVRIWRSLLIELDEVAS